MWRLIYLITVVFLTVLTDFNCSNQKDFETPDQFYGLTQYDINEAKQNHNNATKI